MHKDKELLDILMASLIYQGCTPTVYQRGDAWRAHVNSCGNYWEDNESPYVAMLKASEAWGEAGKPLDGTANIS